jgi:beta-lactamase class D
MTPANLACSLLLVVSYGVIAAHAQDLSGFFKGVSGAIVVYDMKHDRHVPVSKRSTEIVKDILVHEKTPTYQLSAKTGGGPIDEGVYIGWFVGYLETNGNVYFFATNIEGASYVEIRDKRIELTRQILKALGALRCSEATGTPGSERVHRPRGQTTRLFCPCKRSRS